MTIPENVPSELIAGDTWQWTRDLGSDYPAGTWALTYYFENKDSSFSVLATASGTTYAITIAAATTATYRAGRYRWRARAVAAGVNTIVDDGYVDVTTDPAAAGAYDFRSDARKMLDALNATLIGKASNDQLSMSIQGRSLSRLTPSELLDWRDRIRNEVRGEEQADAAGAGRTIKARYGQT